MHKVRRLGIFLIAVMADNEPQFKRRKVERSPSPVYKLDDEDDTYEPYIPVARRRQEKLNLLASRGLNRELLRKQQEEHTQEELKEEERRKERERREKTLLVEAQEVHSRKAAEGMVSSSVENRSSPLSRC